jgi:hypothetical protein
MTVDAPPSARARKNGMGQQRNQIKARRDVSPGNTTPPNRSAVKKIP